MEFLLPIPVSLMQKAGTYYFVLHFKDNHADKYKDHQVKPALEMNQIAAWLPIIYIHGTYKNTSWYGAWCRNLNFVNKETLYFPAGTNIPDLVRNTTPQGIGIVRAGINGGLFDLNTLALVGHVGTGGNWTGNDIQRHLWGFGMNLQGANFLIERMLQVTGTNSYTIPPGVRNFPYGLTGIGCLIRNGLPEPLVNQDNWPAATVRNSRTLVAWDSRNFFLIVCERRDLNLEEPGFEMGWTWQDTVNFLISTSNGLPVYMSNNWHINVSIQGAMMLDGVGSTQFLYRCAPGIGNPWESVAYSAETPPRTVPTIVHAYAAGIITCTFPGHTH